ncbi:inactive serine protease PAMR1 [Alosa sapidissima]|uniref:inactive serine protease PAMR1 n=1 Tax=Alosa sapidissima TaxID=34773 RepID=UPI001C0A4409|nr:inactive serine protease PAMR1 [Alosa sapidissima]
MHSLVRPKIRAQLNLNRSQNPFWPLFALHAMLLCVCTTAWPHVSRPQDDKCPSAEWNAMCRSCCEYDQIRCKCPSQSTQVGYAVPCCRNELDECDPCIIHQGCSIFENCKTCNNGTWQAQDDFYIREQYCTECRQGWSGGDCMKCGGVIRRRQGHVTLESYPINAKCEWTIYVNRGMTVDLRFSMLSLEFDHSCRYDYVEVRDGDRMDSPIIGRYCGSESPPPIISSGYSLHIRFVSDGYNNFDGFFATFQEASACSSSPCLHGGTCNLDPVQSFRCACPADYTGHQCETSVPLKKACGVPPTPLDGDFTLLYEASGNALSMVQYSCHKSYRLHGTTQRSCLSNGTWSGASPMCVKDSNKNNCPSLPKLQHGYYKTTARKTSHTVDFHCKNSYVLSGNSRRSCLADGTWSGKQPQCVKACREPKVSKLVKQRIHPPHVALRRNTTLHGLHSLTNLRIPGTATLSEEVTPIEPLPAGFHSQYTQIEYECASPLYQHFGSAQRTCLKTGKWSGQHVSCSPVCGKLGSVSPQTLADTQWPWHAAIYHHISGARAGRTESEEARFGGGRIGDNRGERWRLTCSGTLVNQYSVVVAAHCVTEPGSAQHVRPADIKVVMGKRNLRVHMNTETSDFLRVAAILIHPNYNLTGPDSDLAVLKLLDKARISEHVMPVCLPRLQGGEVTAQQGYAIDWPLPENSAQDDTAVSAHTGLIELRDVLQCERQYRLNGLPVALTDNMLCGRQHPHSPTPVCYSATGGVVMVQSPPSPRSPHLSPLSGDDRHDSDSDQGVWELVGLVSFGYEQRKCSPELYIIYTRVNNLKDWIEKSIK